MAFSSVDLHLHTTASDGMDSPEELVSKIKNSGIKIFSVTDQDTIASVNSVNRCLPGEVDFIPGIEFSCFSEVGECHILGYHCNIENGSLLGAIDQGIELRKQKLETSITYLKYHYDIHFTTEQLEFLRSLDTAQKPALFRVLRNNGVTDDILSSLESYIMGSEVVESRIPVTTAVRAIKASGGISVWAHPLGDNENSFLDEKSFDRQFQNLMALGVEGMECYYSKYSPDRENFLVSRAEAYRMLIGGGSEYRGDESEKIAPGVLCDNGDSIPAERLSLLKRL